MSQSSEILERLYAGETITPADAYARHGTLALHSIVSELRNQVRPLGYHIECTLIANGAKRWGEYRLVRLGPDPRQSNLFESLQQDSKAL